MKRNLVLILSIIALAFLGTAGAQVEVSAGVARISLIHGDVSSQRGDTGDWAAAALNQPVVAGDSISTGDRSRAEVQLDQADILRLGNNSQAKVATLTRTQVQVQIGQGLAYYSVFKDSEAQIEIDTPNVSIRPTSRDGVYRIEVNGGDTQVAVRKGSADVSTPQGSTRLEKGQAALVRGTAEQAEYKLLNAPSKDDWDSWNSERDSAIRNAQSWRHTNNYYVGSEDLDAYGNWVNVPDYGYVWQPTVAVGWAPYRAGRWVWEPYWGWTWASYEPWGWAPYHYGRWMFWNSSWVWWPGPVTPFYRPFWAPAYVSFFGFGGGGWGFGFGFGGGWGFGNVGWLPIGPCDRFYPWWGHYGNHFNVVNVTHINNFYGHHGFEGMAPLHGGNRFSNLRLAGSDPHVRGGMSMLRSDHFGTGRAVAQPVNAETFRNGKMMTGNLPLVPTRANLTVTNRPASAATMAMGSHNQRFFTRNQPATPPSFDRQAAQVRQAIGRDPQFAGAHAQSGQQVGGQGMSRSMTGTGGKVDGQSVRGGQSSAAAQVRGNDGWQRFGGAQTLQDRSASGQSGSPNRSYTSNATRSIPRNDTGRPAQPGGDRYGWHSFSASGATRNNNRNAVATGGALARGITQAAPANAPPARSQTQVDRSAGWQRFTPQDRAGESRAYDASAGRPTGESGYTRGASSYTPESRSYSRGGPTYTPQSGAPAYRPSTPSYRPPLNLHQPIVTPRSGGGYSGASRGGYSGGGASRGGYSGGGGSRGGSSGGGSHAGRGR